MVLNATSMQMATTHITELTTKLYYKSINYALQIIPFPVYTTLRLHVYIFVCFSFRLELEELSLVPINQIRAYAGLMGIRV